MKIVFLDIDGVLNSRDWVARRPSVMRTSDHHELLQPGSCLAQAEEHFDPVALARLNKLIEVSHAKIVISSSWRKLYALPMLDRMLRHRGLQGQIIIGCTPNLRHTQEIHHRGREIDAWLQLLGTRHYPDAFVILDDDSDMEPHMHRLVQTDPEVGLTEADVERALVMLRA